MKRRFVPTLVAPVLALVGTLVSPQPGTADDRARVAVLDFPVAEGAWSGWHGGFWSAGEARISSVLQELMITELINEGGGKLRLMDRQRLNAVIEEQQFTNSALADDATAVRMGKLAGVSYLVTGKVTRFAYKKSEVKTGWGVGAVLNKMGASGLASSLASSANIQKASFTGRLDVRVIDVRTGEILASVSDEGTVSDVGVEVAGTGNEIEWNEELVNKVFEPSVKQIADKIVPKIQKAWNNAPRDLPATKEVVATAPVQPKPARDAAPEMDKHFFLNNEYLVLEQEYAGGSGWAHAFVARMLTPASAQTKDEAEFFIVAGSRKGEKLWTKHFAKTRPATREDITLGTLAYHLDGGLSDQGVYTPPKDRDELVGANWFLGTINDDSTLYKGYLSLSGYKCGIDGLRVVAK